MNYVYCPSYSSIYLVLHLQNRGDNVAVITSNASIQRYCDYANITCIPLRYSDNSNFWRLLPTVYQLVRRKAYLDDFLRFLDVRPGDSFFSVGSTNDCSCYYLAKQWARRGKVYVTTELENIEYWPIDDHVTPHLERYVPRLRRAQRIIRMVLGLRLHIYDLKAAKLVLGIGDEFIREHGITHIDLGAPERLKLEAIDNSSVDLGSFDNLVIAGYPPILGFVTLDSLTELYQNLSGIASDLVIKPHPIESRNTEYAAREKKVIDFFKGFRVLPLDIPVELMYQSVRRNVLSVQSEALLSAAKMEHFDTICLMHLVEYRENRKPWAQGQEKMLRERSGGRIKFVKDIEELKAVLRSNA